MSDNVPVPPPVLIERSDQQFTVQRAAIDDLSAILAIYNQSIAGKTATANLTPVTTEERLTWFGEHMDSATRPIYVVTMRPTGDDDAAPTVVAWGSFSDLYARTAYHISTEISIYLHQAYHGQGLGSALIRWMLTQAPTLNIRNVVALIFSHNEPSLGLFKKFGFKQWGYMPKVCDMQGFIADVVMLAYVTSDNKDDA